MEGSAVGVGCVADEAGEEEAEEKASGGEGAAMGVEELVGMERAAAAASCERVRLAIGETRSTYAATSLMVRCCRMKVAYSSPGLKSARG
jgi:hypothetical protein